jgi:hypothetical protein
MDFGGSYFSRKDGISSSDGIDIDGRTKTAKLNTCAGDVYEF